MERDVRGFLNCNKCSRRFVSQFGFQNHLNTPHDSIVTETPQTMHKDASNLPEEKVDERPYQSDKCKTSFETQTVQTHCSPHQCQECQKAYSTKYTLQQHKQAIHEKIKHYPCPQCIIVLLNQPHL